MSELTILLHGWSDTSKSFRDMKSYLVARGIGDVSEILYADYESREDNITFADIVDGLNDRFIEKGIISATGEKLRDVNVVVHSTGGLVIRHWIWRYYYRDGNRIDRCPVVRIVMLAPANFGSPLAHRGKSFVGSLFKGRKEVGDFLEVGRQVLDGLELASPYQWEMACRDSLIDDAYFVPRKIQLTVLVGADGYGGLKGVANKAGTDGTVVIAGTSLTPVKFLLDPCKPVHGKAGKPYDWLRTQGANSVAFAVLPGYDHGSIVSGFAADGPEPSLVQTLVLRALLLPARRAGAFNRFARELRAVTRRSYAAGAAAHRFQQFLVRAVDDQGNAVRDYNLEFLLLRADSFDPAGWRRQVRSSSSEEEWSERIGKIFVRDAHENRTDHSLRRFLVDYDEITTEMARAREDLGQEVTLAMRVHVPPIDRGIRYSTDRLQTVALSHGPEDGGVPDFLFPNTTTLVEIKIDRQTDYVWLGPRPAKR